MKKRRIVLTVGGILALIGLILLVWDFRRELMLVVDPTVAHRHQLMKLIRSHGAADIVLLTIVIGLLNAIPGMSNSLLCILAGLCYGPWIGFAMNWVGNVLGSCLVVELIKHVDVSKKIKTSRLLTALTDQQHPLIGLTIGYMIPVIPSILVDYAGVRMKLDRGHFLLMIAGGMLPTSFLYAFGGDALFNAHFKRCSGALVALLILIAMYFLVRRRMKKPTSPAV